MEPKIGKVIETPNRSNGYYFVVKHNKDLFYLLYTEISIGAKVGDRVEINYVSEGTYGRHYAVILDEN